MAPEIVFSAPGFSRIAVFVRPAPQPWGAACCPPQARGGGALPSAQNLPAASLRDGYSLIYAPPDAFLRGVVVDEDLVSLYEGSAAESTGLTGVFQLETASSRSHTLPQGSGFIRLDTI